MAPASQAVGNPPTEDFGAQADAGADPAEEVPRLRARLAELDSDHYLTLREAEQVSGLLLDFLAAAAPYPG